MFRFFNLTVLVLVWVIPFHLDFIVTLIHFHLDSNFLNSQNKLVQFFVSEDPLLKYSIFLNVQERDLNIADEQHFGPYLSIVPMLQIFVFSKEK